MWESTHWLSSSATDIKIAYQKLSISPRAMRSIKEASTTISSAHSPHHCFTFDFYFSNNPVPSLFSLPTTHCWALEVKKQCLPQHVL